MQSGWTEDDMGRRTVQTVDSDEGLLVDAECCGNPDRGQFSPPAPDLRLLVRDLQNASRAFLAWTKLWNLGAGNVGHARVVDKHGVVVAEISYNGRVWPPGHDVGSTPLYKPTEEDWKAASDAAYAAHGL